MIAKAFYGNEVIWERGLGPATERWRVRSDLLYI